MGKGTTGHFRSTYGHRLNGCVLDVQVLDGRGCQAVGIEKLGFGDTPVAAFGIPPTCAVGVQGRTAGTLDRDIVTLDLEQGPLPFLVAPGGLALEDDLWSR